MRRRAAVLALVAGGVSAVWAAPTELGPALQGAAARVLDEGAVYNIIDWDGGPLPPVYERSDQLPITLEDVRKLVAGKFSDTAIVNMLKAAAVRLRRLRRRPRGASRSRGVRDGCWRPFPCTPCPRTATST